MLRAARLRAVWRPPLPAARFYANHTGGTDTFAVRSPVSLHESIRSPPPAPNPRPLGPRPRVKADHGLYHFFRKRETTDGKFAGYETLELPDDRRKQRHSGRAWRAQELRNKSFADLHTLWYVALRERNLLAAQGAEHARLGLGAPHGVVRARAVRKTMARIKYVLDERRRAHAGAVQLLGAQKAAAKEAAEDARVLAVQRRVWNQEQARLAEALRARARRMAARRERAEAQAAAARSRLAPAAESAAAALSAEEIEAREIAEHKRELAERKARRMEKLAKREQRRELIAKTRLEKQLAKTQADEEESPQEKGPGASIAAGLFGKGPKKP